jgi:aminoglycoside 3-N-acetyltransferase
MSLLETASGFADRHLKPEHFLFLRGCYSRARQRLAPLIRRVYGTFDAADLRHHLEEQLGGDFEILMVHSSVDHLAPMYTGNPLDFVKMLMEFCGPDRTLAMPAFYFGDPKIGGAAATFKQKPIFDIRRTPSQMGLATELFRRSRGVVQSRHPVYRIAAIGPLADELVAGHETAGSPAGAGTPFDFMARKNAMIIGIGKPFEVLTQVHHPEDVMGDDFPVPASSGESIPMTLVDGKTEISFELKGRMPLWRRDMWKLRNIMSPTLLREWTFHNVPLFTTRAGDVTLSITEAAKLGVTIYDEP